MDKNNPLPDMNRVVGAILKQRNSSLRAQSLQMGHNHNYLNLALRRRHLPMDLLLDLSNALGVNLLEYYTPLLHAHVRPTAAERDLHRQLADLRAELDRVTEEKDRYWRVIERRG